MTAPIRPALAALLALAFMAAALPGSARAQGFVIDADVASPRRPDPGPRHPHDSGIALVRHRVTASLRDQVARTRVEQAFENRTGRDVEATYVFPIPAGASVADFEMAVGGKVMGAEVLDREKAREIYEEIVRRRRDPALLELVGNGLVRARVFPVPRQGRVEIRFTLEQALSEDGGLLSYRYPLRSSLYSPLAVEEISIAVDVESSRALAAIHSPTHRIDVARRGDKAAKISFEERHRPAAEDFVLLVGVTDSEFGLHVVTHGGRGEDGYFHLLLSPARDFPDDAIGRKDFVFVLDTSGSMQGAKFEQATGALRFALERLREGDRFTLIPFSTEPRPFSSSLVDATKASVAEAQAFVGRLSAVGGTNIADALEAGLGALARDRDPKRFPILVFLTDGLPTVSETDPHAILSRAGKLASESRCRLFVFGVGSDVNTFLLDRLAEDNRGTRDYVTERENIEVKVSSLVTKIESPVLSDLEIDFGGAVVADVHPRRIPDLFAGGQVSLVGRYRGEGRRRVRLKGRTGDVVRTYAYEADFTPRPDENASLPRLWAQRRVGFLLDEIRLRGETRELRDEVERLSKLYGIVTPYTALLVTEDEPRPRLSADGFIGAVSRPGDSSAPSAPRAGGAGAPAGGPSASVGLSLETKKLRELERLEDASEAEGPEGRGGKHRDGRVTVLSKVFARAADGVTWVDAAIARETSPPREVRVVTYSADYFALIAKSPVLARYFGVGERVKVLHEGVVYDVRPDEK